MFFAYYFTFLNKFIVVSVLTMSLKPKFELNTPIICRAQADGFFYDARIADVKTSDVPEPVYTVHYQVRLYIFIGFFRNGI